MGKVEELKLDFSILCQDRKCREALLVLRNAFSNLEDIVNPFSPKISLHFLAGNDCHTILTLLTKFWKM